jgi:hypothetical protein
MHYATPLTTVEFEPLDKFLKAMGLASVEPIPNYKVTSIESLPDESQVVILDYPRE